MIEVSRNPIHTAADLPGAYSDAVCAIRQLGINIATPPLPDIAARVSEPAQLWFADRRERGADDVLVIAPRINGDRLGIAALAARFDKRQPKESKTVVDDLFKPSKQRQQPTYLNRSAGDYPNGAWPDDVHNMGYDGLWQVAVILDREVPLLSDDSNEDPGIGRIEPITVSQFVALHALCRFSGRPYPDGVTHFSQYEPVPTGGDMLSWPVGVSYYGRLVIGATYEYGAPGRYALALDPQPAA